MWYVLFQIYSILSLTTVPSYLQVTRRQHRLSSPARLLAVEIRKIAINCWSIGVD